MSFTNLPGYSEFIQNPNAYIVGLRDIETNPFARSKIEPERTFFGNLSTQASNYAFVDFLVRKNLSAVVDAPDWVGIYFPLQRRFSVLFGATLPAQQVTESVAVPAVIRKDSG